MRARAGNRYREPPGRAYALPGRFWALSARGGSRGLLPQAGAARLAREPLGKPFTLDGLWRHWLLVQVTEELSAQVTEGFAVPASVPVC